MRKNGFTCAKAEGVEVVTPVWSGHGGASSLVSQGEKDAQDVAEHLAARQEGDAGEANANGGVQHRLHQQPVVGIEGAQVELAEAVLRDN